MGTQVGVSFDFELNKRQMQLIEAKLEGLEHNISKLLKNAVNNTAKQARLDLAKKAQETYTVKNATQSKMEATLIVTGEPLPLKDFKISKSVNGVRAKVLKSGGSKPLEKGGIKAFVGNIARKGQTRKKNTSKGKAGTQVVHIAVAQRETAERLPIKTLWSNSVPKMVGNEARVYGVVAPSIRENLQKNIQKQIDKILGGS